MARPVRKRSIRLEERPFEVSRYWKRVVITDAEREALGPNGWNYIAPSTCGALTFESGIFELPAGTGKANSVQHSHGNEEMGYILAGRGWVAVEDETHEFGPGDFIFVPAHARHAWQNDGTETVRVLFWRPIKPMANGRPLDMREYDVRDAAAAKGGTADRASR
jgi:mannose-6-phosphate isomerase-like protein (cupin superfamily)